MAIEVKSIEVAKEIKDIGDFVVELVADIRAKKPVQDIVSGSLGNLITAIEGISDVDDEFKGNRKAALATIGLITGELTNAIIGE